MCGSKLKIERGNKKMSLCGRWLTLSDAISNVNQIQHKQTLVQHPMATQWTGQDFRVASKNEFNDGALFRRFDGLDDSGRSSYRGRASGSSGA
jgi:hypothetical protein